MFIVYSIPKIDKKGQLKYELSKLYIYIYISKNVT